MSKAVKSLIMRDYKARIAGGKEEYSDSLLISIRGLKGTATTKFRQDLAKKNIKVTVVRNALARKTFKGTTLEPLIEMLTGPSAVAYGGNSVVEVAREVVSLIATLPAVELKGAVLDGTVFKGKAGVTELSKFPTREEGISQNVTLILSPGKKLAAQVKGPGANLAGLVKAIETKLEKGEAITKVA
jgi:large subunit ribosomal protein L10